MSLRTATDQAAADSFSSHPAPYSGTLLASADRKVAPFPVPVEFSAPPGAGGVMVTVDVTAISGASASLTAYIDGYDPASGTWHTLLTSAALTATGTVHLLVSPGAVAVSNLAVALGLYETLRLRLAVAGTAAIKTAAGATGTDFSGAGGPTTFTLQVDTTTVAITLDADYTDAAGVAAEINTQFGSDVATLSGTTLVITSPTLGTGGVVIITLYTKTGTADTQLANVNSVSTPTTLTYSVGATFS